VSDKHVLPELHSLRAIQESTVHRFADFSVHPIHTHLLVAILEDHTDDRPSAVHNEICMINTLTQELRSFVSGADFYSSPRFSPDGARIAWKQWFHPDMPWEGAEIYVADIQVENDTFIPKNTVHIAGERGTISVSYPLWVSNDALIFTNDESGYQNPWIFAPGPLAKAVPIFNVAIAEDFGGPAWTLGGSPFAPLDSSGKRMLFVSTRDGRSALYLADLESRTLPLEIECPYAVMQNVRQVPAGNAEVVFIGCKVDESQTLVHCTLQPVQSTKPKYKTLKSTSSTISAAASFPLEIVSIPQPITLEVTSGEPLHVVFYPPNNPEYAGTNLPGELPPCVLNVHGGPTWMTGQGLDWEKTFYTSRGWAWYVVRLNPLQLNLSFLTQVRCELWWLVGLRTPIHVSRQASRSGLTPALILAPVSVLQENGVSWTSKIAFVQHASFPVHLTTL